jgi:putative flippase GtrA
LIGERSDKTVMKYLEHLTGNPVFMQLFRYALTGGGITLIGAGIYWIAADIYNLAPLLATLVAYLVAVVLGYILHSRYSFKDHGRRDNTARTTSRFFLGSLISYGLNSALVWVVTGPMGFAPVWGIVPMIFITPIIIFIINRNWVFK